MPEYELPQLLTFADGSRVTTAADWELKRRPELLQLFREHVYGTAPEIDYTTTACAASHEVLSDEEVEQLEAQAILEGSGRSRRRLASSALVALASSALVLASNGSPSRSIAAISRFACAVSG